MRNHKQCHNAVVSAISRRVFRYQTFNGTATLMTKFHEWTIRARHIICVTCMYVCIYIYIFIYIYRERESTKDQSPIKKKNMIFDANDETQSVNKLIILLHFDELIGEFIRCRTKRTVCRCIVIRQLLLAVLSSAFFYFFFFH